MYSIYLHINIHTYVYVYIYIYVCVCVCVYMYEYVYIYFCGYIYKYMYIYAYTYINIYIHTYAYIHTCICMYIIHSHTTTPTYTHPPTLPPTLPNKLTHPHAHTHVYTVLVHTSSNIPSSQSSPKIRTTAVARPTTCLCLLASDRKVLPPFAVSDFRRHMTVSAYSVHASSTAHTPSGVSFTFWGRVWLCWNEKKHGKKHERASARAANPAQCARQGQINLRHCCFCVCTKTLALSTTQPFNLCLFSLVSVGVRALCPASVVPLSLDVLVVHRCCL